MYNLSRAYCTQPWKDVIKGLEGKEMKYIICPACECQYTPGEIFLPKHFLGQHKNVDKDYQGKIVDIFGGIEQKFQEVYTCDKCGITFSVEANITYKTQQLSKREATDYKQKL